MDEADGGEMYDEGGEEDEGDEEGEEGDVADGSGGGGGKKRKKRKRGKRRKGKIRGNLSTKPKDFQVRTMSLCYDYCL